MNDAIAKLDLICVRPSSERISITIQIGKPYEIRDGNGADCAACPVAIRGLHDRLPDVYGEDTLQALLLAVRLVHSLLTDFVQKGGKILDEGGVHEIDMKHYFGATIHFPRREGRGGDSSRRSE